MSLKFKLIEASALAIMIGAIGKRKVALDKAVQDAAVQVVAQSIVHRNATPAMQLFDALAGSMRRDALVVYLERFGNLKWNKQETETQKKGLVFHENAKVKALKDDAARDAWLTEATETLWYALKRENPVKSVYDADEAISSLIDRLHKMAKRGTKLENIEVLQTVERAYRDYKVAQLQRDSQMTPDVKDAFDARAAGKATPAQLAKLTEFFSREKGEVTQVQKAA